MPINNLGAGAQQVTQTTVPTNNTVEKKNDSQKISKDTAVKVAAGVGLAALATVGIYIATKGKGKAKVNPEDVKKAETDVKTKVENETKTQAEKEANVNAEGAKPETEVNANETEVKPETAEKAPEELLTEKNTSESMSISNSEEKEVNNGAAETVTTETESADDISERIDELIQRNQKLNENIDKNIKEIEEKKKAAEAAREQAAQATRELKQRLGKNAATTIDGLNRKWDTVADKALKRYEQYHKKGFANGNGVKALEDGSYSLTRTEGESKWVYYSKDGKDLDKIDVFKKDGELSHSITFNRESDDMFADDALLDIHANNEVISYNMERPEKGKPPVLTEYTNTAAESKEGENISHINSDGEYVTVTYSGVDTKVLKGDEIYLQRVNSALHGDGYAIR